MNLLDEFAEANERLTDKVVGRLTEIGVPQEVVFGPHSAVVGVERIATNDNYYHPDPDGKPAIIVPVADDYGPGFMDPIDLCAWHPADPEQWFLRVGSSALMGGLEVERARIMGSPLHLHATPLRWLQADATGAVVLDWTASLLFRLQGARRVLADSPALADRLTRRLQAEHDAELPEIRFAEDSQNAA